MNPVDLSLYGILDPDHANGRDLPELAKASIRGGVTLLQLRAKHFGKHETVELARAILEAVGDSVPVLVNDDPAIAKAAGAGGVHLGQEDLAPAAARNMLGPQAIIGLTIKTVEHAHAAPVDLVDYACIGGVFDTKSKKNAVSIGVDGWRERADILRTKSQHLPVGAIAGINRNNAGPLIEAGADGIAVISAIFGAADVEASARSLAAIIAEARAQ
jgi:thiamine-phosphate diphosphorylase